MVDDWQVVDKSGQISEFEDTTKVEKYEMTDTDYAERSGKFLCVWHVSRCRSVSRHGVVQWPV